MKLAAEQSPLASILMNDHCWCSQGRRVPSLLVLAPPDLPVPSYPLGLSLSCPPHFPGLTVDYKLVSSCPHRLTSLE